MQNRFNLQDTFLTRARRSRMGVTLFLMNGYDSFVVVLTTDSKQQIIYKHAISTIVPERAVPLEGEGGQEG